MLPTTYGAYMAHVISHLPRQCCVGNNIDYTENIRVFLICCLNIIMATGMGLNQCTTFSSSEDQIPVYLFDWKNMFQYSIIFYKYVSKFYNFLQAIDIEKEERKPVLLLHSGDFEFYDSFPDTGTTYNSLNPIPSGGRTMGPMSVFF